MPFEDSSQIDKHIAALTPPLLAQSSRFRWTATPDADGLVSGWQDHLTWYVIAAATVSVNVGKQKHAQINEVKVLGDPLNLYQVAIHGQEVAVQVSYACLRQAFMDVPYDCSLLLKTEVGGRFVTIPAPRPPGQAEWRRVLKELWFQLQRAGDVALVLSDAPGLPARGQPLSIFRLHPELDWKEADIASVEGIVSQWQRELRFVPDPDEPGMLRGQMGWNDLQWISNPTLNAASLTDRASIHSQADQIKPLQSLWAHGEQALSSLLQEGSLLWNERWREVSRGRVAMLGAAVLLLCLVVGMSVGATRGNATAKQSLTDSKPSSTNNSVPPGMPTATPPAENASQASPVPAPQPTAPAVNQPAPAPSAGNTSPGSPVSRPTPTPAPSIPNQPAPTPTPPSVPTSGPAPSPTPTPMPTDTPTPTPPAPAPTDTPTPTPTDTPTPTPPTPTPTDTPTPAPTTAPSSTPTSEESTFSYANVGSMIS